MPRMFSLFEKDETEKIRELIGHNNYITHNNTRDSEENEVTSTTIEKQPTIEQTVELDSDSEPEPTVTAVTRPARKPALRRSSRKRKGRTTATAPPLPTVCIGSDSEPEQQTVSNITRQSKRAKSVGNNKTSKNGVQSSVIVDLDDEKCELPAAKSMKFDESIDIIARWENDKTRYVRIPIRMCQTFEHIFQKVAAMDDVSSSRITLRSPQDEITIQPSDTPMGLNFEFNKIVDISVKEDSLDFSEISEPGVTDIKMISLTVQGAGKKNQIVIKIKQTDIMGVLMEKYAASQSIDVKSLVFSFDGESFGYEVTAEDLGIEDGEMIDVKVK